MDPEDRCFMSRWALEEHLHALYDIRSILRAMKNLALTETQELTRFITTQRRVVESVEIMTQDFVCFYPSAARLLGKGRPVWLIIGSERGFCGDYNERLLEGTERHLRKHSSNQPLLVAVGRKLEARVEHDSRVAACLAGPTVAEEVPVVLLKLMEELKTLQIRQKPGVRLEFIIVHQSPAANGNQIHVHQPMKRAAEYPARFAHPPLLTLDPLTFARNLIDQHLFYLLHEMFYSSLMAENLDRFQHMDQAIQRLDNDAAELVLRRNTLRQEEITEEIELIMLSADLLKQLY